MFFVMSGGLIGTVFVFDGVNIKEREQGVIDPVKGKGISPAP